MATQRITILIDGIPDDPSTWADTIATDDQAFLDAIAAAADLDLATKVAAGEVTVSNAIEWGGRPVQPASGP